MRPDLRRLVVALCSGALVACGSTPTSPSGPTPAAIHVVPDSSALYVGDSVQLVAVVVDSSDHAISGETLMFASADTVVAGVSTSGRVAARHVGTTTVTVSDGAIQTPVPIVVRAVPVKTIQVTPSSAALAIGDSLQLVAIIDSQGVQVGGPGFTFTSMDTLIATVTTNGRVAAVGGGADTITVTSGALVAQVPITVASARVAIAGRPFGVAVSSLGQAYVTRQDDNALTRVIVGPDTLAGIVTVGADPGDVVFNAAGTVAYVTNFAEGTVGKITVGTAAQSDTAGFGGSPAFHVRMSGSGAHLFVAINNGFLYTLDAATLARVDSVAIDDSPNGLAIKGDTIAYVSSTATARVAEIDLKGDSVLRYFNVGDIPQEVVLSSDGGTLYVANQAGWVDKVTLSTGAIGTPIGGIAEAFGMARTATGDTLLVSSLDGHVRRILASTGAVIRRYDVGGTPRRVAIAPSGAVLVANEGGWVDIIR